MIQNLVFLLEEPSARAMLEGVVPRLISADVTVTYLTFQGKQDLENNIERKIRLWQKPASAFIVMRDQDSAVCTDIKQRLLTICARAGQKILLVRIACHELESFYLGDLSAVEEVYQIPMPNQQNRKYRVPDALANSAEELKKITHGRYQKIDGSRQIGALLKLDGSNCSHSFNVLCDGIRKIVTM